MRNVEDRWLLKDDTPSVRYGKGNRYRVKFFNPRTGKPSEKTFPDGKKGEAQAFAAAQETHMREGRQLDIQGGRQLIRVYGPAYVASLVVKDSTRERYNQLMDHQILPHLGGRQLIQCTSSTIQTWIRELQVEGFSPKTIRLAYDLVCAMFKRAILDRRLSLTPCTDITLPEVEDKEYWIPEDHQVHQLAAAIAPRYKAAIYLGSGCGLRWGETWGLDIDAIDFAKKVVKVRHQLVRPKGTGTAALAKLKTRAAYREVPLPDHVIAALREHVAAGYAHEVRVIDQTAKIRKGQSYPVVTKRMLFTDGNGKFLRPSPWSKVMAAARVAVEDMDGGFTFHGLRHYFASAQFKGGANPKKVAKLCGHASFEITLRIYTHFFKDDDEDSRQIMNDAFAAGAAKVTQPLAHVLYMPDRQDSEPTTGAA